MRRRPIILIGSLMLSWLILIWPGPAAATEKTVLVPVDSFPPFQIFPYDGGVPYGEVISVLQAIVRKVNLNNGYQLEMTFTPDTPFKRCLLMMKTGKAQLIGGIQDKADRRSYMVLIPYKPNSNKIFLLRARDPRKIRYLADLEGKTVGTVLGYTYFKEFDKNSKIKKSTARAIELSLRKLDAKRIDAVICPENQWQVLKTEDPDFTSKFKVEAYRYDKANPVNIGISKDSWLGSSEYIQAFETAIREMNQSGEIVKIIADFYRTYSYKETPQ